MTHYHVALSSSALEGLCGSCAEEGRAAAHCIAFRCSMVSHVSSTCRRGRLMEALHWQGIVELRALTQQNTLTVAS